MSEQTHLRCKDVDLLTGFITVPRSKYGESHRVPINCGFLFLQR